MHKKLSANRLIMNPGLRLVDSKRGRGLACTFCYAGVVVVVMVTCQQSQGQGQRSKVRTFDKAVIGCPLTGSRGRGHGTPRVHWAVTSHCDVTPSRGDTW